MTNVVQLKKKLTVDVKGNLTAHFYWKNLTQNIKFKTGTFPLT